MDYFICAKCDDNNIYDNNLKYVIHIFPKNTSCSRAVYDDDDDDDDDDDSIPIIFNQIEIKFINLCRYCWVKLKRHVVIMFEEFQGSDPHIYIKLKNNRTLEYNEYALNKQYIRY
jgi:hypothetical protein